MYALTSAVRCTVCGTAFPVIGGHMGATVQCPRCRRTLTIGYVSQLDLRSSPTQSLQPSSGEVLLKLLGYAAIGVIAYKGLQALLDEDLGCGEFPRWFRNEMRGEHVALHGCRCLQCGRRVRYADLTVDHIVALRNGGRTSRANAAVMCRWCNSSKGAANTLFDYIRGRAD